MPEVGGEVPFAASDLRRINAEVSTKHFVPLENGRDRFGNRLFPAQDTGYIDKQGEMVRAAMLTSPQGQEFIGRNHGILRDVTSGLTHFYQMRRDITSLKESEEFQMSPGRSLRYLDSGGQSYIYLLTISQPTPDEGTSEPRRYIIKVRNDYRPDAYYLSQPYINEMLQTQAVGQDFATELSNLGVALPTFLFATGQMSCREYIEGSPPQSSPELEHTLDTLGSTIGPYIANQEKSGNTLWNNIAVDAWISEGAAAGRNFLQSNDGRLYWIDPLVHEQTADHVSRNPLRKRELDTGS